MLATTTPLLEEETNPWTSAAIRFDEAAARLRLDDGMCKVLKSANKEITVHIPVQLDDGRIEVFTGYRVQHSIARGPGKGGVRYAPDVTLDEVRAQAPRHGSGLDARSDPGLRKCGRHGGAPDEPRGVQDYLDRRV